MWQTWIKIYYIISFIWIFCWRKTFKGIYRIRKTAFVLVDSSWKSESSQNSRIACPNYYISRYLHSIFIVYQIKVFFFIFIGTIQIWYIMFSKKFFNMEMIKLIFVSDAISFPTSTIPPLILLSPRQENKHTIISKLKIIKIVYRSPTLTLFINDLFCLFWRT